MGDDLLGSRGFKGCRRAYAPHRVGSLIVDARVLVIGSKPAAPNSQSKQLPNCPVNSNELAINIRSSIFELTVQYFELKRIYHCDCHGN